MPGFIQIYTYSPCGPFIKHRELIQKFREPGNLKHIHKNELDITCSANYSAYSDGKDLPKRTISDKILKDKSYEVVIYPKYDEYQRRLASNYLTNEFKKLTKKNVFATFKDNNWAAVLTEIGSLWVLNIYYV